jgi:2-(1,2-epoxy-1,2-dihydrophenyl)acetyl-CoA isomerase
MSDVLVEKADRVARITLNRPESLNALRVEMARELLRALEDAANDDGIRVVVLTGAGRAFCSGGDITFMQEVVSRGGAWSDFRALVDFGRDIALAIHRMEKPVLAAVNGAAAGGGMSLALACDVRWASDRAVFAQSFVRLGLHPDWSALYYLPRLIGASRALELMWTGDRVDAAEALRLGIVSRVLSGETLIPEILEFAERLGRGPAAAIATIKRSLGDSVSATLETTLDREVEAQERCWNTADAREGFAAFLGKREAKFEGK